MSKHRIILAALGALTLFLFNPELSQAQHHGGGHSGGGAHFSGGHSGGGAHFSGGHSGGGAHFSGGGAHFSGGGAHFSHGSPHFSGAVPHVNHGTAFSHGTNFRGVNTAHFRDFHDRDFHNHNGFRTFPFVGYGLGWPYYSGYGYSPTYYDSSYDYAPDYSYSAPYPDYDYGAVTPSYSYSTAPLPAEPVTVAATATVDVRVPPNAEIWFDGVKTTQVGSTRTFVSPLLTPGQTFVYDVRARWPQDGSFVDQTRTVNVAAGQRVLVDFLAPAVP